MVFAYIASGIMAIYLLQILAALCGIKREASMTDAEARRLQEQIHRINTALAARQNNRDNYMTGNVANTAENNQPNYSTDITINREHRPLGQLPTPQRSATFYTVNGQAITTVPIADVYSLSTGIASRPRFVPNTNIPSASIPSAPPAYNQSGLVEIDIGDRSPPPPYAEPSAPPSDHSLYGTKPV